MILGSLISGVAVAFVSAVSSMLMGLGIPMVVLSYVAGGFVGMALVIGLVALKHRFGDKQLMAFTA